MTFQPCRPATIKLLPYGGAPCGEIYSAVPEEFWPLIDEIDQHIKENNDSDAGEVFRKLSKELAKTYNLRAKI